MASLDVGGTSTRASSPLLSPPASTIPSTKQSNTLNAFSTLQRRPAYATALLLHPAYQAKYININWLEEWRPSAFESARTIWAEYKDHPVASRLQSTRVLDKPPTKFDTLHHALKVTDHNEEEDELEKFLNGVPTPIFSTPLQWWIRCRGRIWLMMQNQSVSAGHDT